MFIGYTVRGNGILKGIQKVSNELKVLHTVQKPFHMVWHCKPLVMVVEMVSRRYPNLGRYCVAFKTISYGLKLQTISKPLVYYLD